MGEATTFSLNHLQSTSLWGLVFVVVFLSGAISVFSLRLKAPLRFSIIEVQCLFWAFDLANQWQFQFSILSSKFKIWQHSRQLGYPWTLHSEKGLTSYQLSAFKRTEWQSEKCGTWSIWTVQDIMVTWCACHPTAMVTTVHNCLRKGLAEQKWEGTHDVLSWKKLPEKCKNKT